MIDFPDWVRPPSPCRTRTFTWHWRTRHGLQRVEVRELCRPSPGVGR